MSERIKLTAVFEPDEDGWIQARILEIPGVVTCGKTIEEARFMLRDALKEVLLSYMEEGAPAPLPAEAQSEPLEVIVA